MKWNIGTTPSADAAPALPEDHPPVASSSGAQCPVDHKAMAALKAKAKPKSEGAQCPIDHSGMAAGSASALGAAVGSAGALNPLNSMPIGLSPTQKAPGQVLDLPTERTLSSIPRPKSEDDAVPVWEYPSPQQFYNALVRKGWETPEESIEMVVDIHNWINEGAWDEVMKWEKRLPGGEDAQLARFQGRPGELSPKARMNLWLGKLFPSKFNTEPPFDRHDWIVTRPIFDAAGNKTKDEASQRYVIDYYSAPPDEDGNPVFSLDVRPAVDSFGAVSERIKVAVSEWLDGEGK